MRQSTGIERDTELVLAARNGDPWARDQLITAHLPLIHTTVALAMNGRHGAEHVEHVVRETMLRALDGLPTLTDPGVFRPWLVAIAVDGIRRHRHQQPAGYDYGADAERSSAHGQAYEIIEAARWLDPDDGEQLALWWLECAGELTRYETAAALRWPTEEAPARIDAVRARLDAARVVVGALAGNPACPFLGREAADWDGRPSAPWRDHLAHHTLGCGHCAPRWHALVPAELLLATTSPVLAARTDEASPDTTTAAAFAAAAGGPGTGPAAYAATDGDPYRTAGGTDPSDTAHLGAYGQDHAADLTEPYVLAGSAGHTRPHVPRSTPASSASPAPGRHGTRAALRRRRQTQERSRRRAVIAAGVVVMAVTGGAFSLSGGRGDDEIFEANRVTAPELDLPLDQDPSTHSGTPSSAATTPTTSPSASTSATGRPPASASPSAKPTTASPRPVRTAKPAPVRTT
ncbi:sigma-70 family RNA polymerase sigma factor, partial [Streptomyces aureus]|uniref:sigma-70 family RNA polymerase sigma factor n=1 Tax=Streptomyces aureus TaxID=193461 RepID=UPI0006E45AE5